MGRERESLGGVELKREIAVSVRRAEQSANSRNSRVVAPKFRVLVARLLIGDAHLRLPLFSKSGSALHVDSPNASTISVLTLKHLIAVGIHLIKLTKHKDVTQVREETLHEKVGLDRAKGMIPVHGSTDTLAALFFQIVCENGDHAVAADNGDVKVFIVGLRRTKTGALGEAEIDIAAGIETNVGTRRNDDVVNE